MVPLRIMTVAFSCQRDLCQLCLPEYWQRWREFKLTHLGVSRPVTLVNIFSAGTRAVHARYPTSRRGAAARCVPSRGTQTLRVPSLYSLVSRCQARCTACGQLCRVGGAKRQRAAHVAHGGPTRDTSEWMTPWSANRVRDRRTALHCQLRAAVRCMFLRQVYRGFASWAVPPTDTVRPPLILTHPH